MNFDPVKDIENKADSDSKVYRLRRKIGDENIGIGNDLDHSLLFSSILCEIVDHIAYSRLSD